MAKITPFKNKAGKRVPSVSTIVGQLDKPGLMYWAHKLGLEGVKNLREHRDANRKAGILMHELIEMCLRPLGPGTIKLSEVNIDGIYQNTDTAGYTKEEIDISRPAFARALKLLNDLCPMTTELMEYSMISEAHQFGGRLDWYGVTNQNGPLTLLDIKSGKDVYLDTVVQMAAYRGLLLELGNRVERVVIARISPVAEEGEELRVLTDSQLDAAWNIFLHLREMYDLKKIVEADFKKAGKAA